jgi:DUF4097 and DUF4098 domain-containing protein YvlB
MQKLFHSVLIVIAIAAIQLPAFAKCPVSDGATLVVRAPIGHLLVETSGNDAVDVQVSPDLAVKETCTRDGAQYTAEAGQIRGTIDWKIIVPPTVNLDLVTFGGSIRMNNLDAAATLRTTGGSVTVGNIKGKTTIITQGGLIRAGNIGSSAEMRSSSAGSLEVGDIVGNADLHTAGGPITAGVVDGKVIADASGGAIYIKGSHGEVTVTADPGEIFVGDALQVFAKTSGGSIIVPKVRGPLRAMTESGDIKLASAGGWVEATTGSGDIHVTMNPVNFDADLHVNLETGVGNVTIFVPERMRASFDASIDRPALSPGRRIVSEIPMYGQAITTLDRNVRGAPVPPINRFNAPDRQQGTLNGGGNPIKLHTSLGKIEIFKIKL